MSSPQCLNLSCPKGLQLVCMGAVLHKWTRTGQSLLWDSWPHWHQIRGGNMASEPCFPALFPLLVYTTDNSLTHASVGATSLCGNPTEDLRTAFAFFWEPHRGGQARKTPTHHYHPRVGRSLYTGTTQIEIQQQRRHLNVLLLDPPEVGNVLPSSVTFHAYLHSLLWSHYCLFRVCLPDRF